MWMMTRVNRERSFGHDLASLALCGIMAGVVIAALAFPFVGLAGLGAKDGAESFADLPSQLRIPQSAQDTYVYANDGKTLLTTFYDENRTDVAVSSVAPVMRRAIVAAEDTRFYEHDGVDPRGVIRSLVANRQAGTVEQGASTLTMQYVRNVLINSASTPQQVEQATAQTPARKLREMRYALALEKKLTKAQILERYLNIVYFGHNAYGIAAAARTYFDTTPGKLSLNQAATLAGMVKSPNAYDPAGDLDQQHGVQQRRSYVLDSMAKLHYISRAEARKTAKEPIILLPGRTPNGCTEVPAAHLDWGFYCDYLVQWWEQQAAFGGSTVARDNSLKEGGYKIVTGLDPAVQASAYRQSKQVYGLHSPKALPTAAIQPGTGRVLALAVNRNYSLAPNPGGANYPNTVDQLVAGGGDITGYQTGSTFKMFTMLAALERGKPLNTGFNAPGQLSTRYPVYSSGCGGYYCPVNDNPSWMDGYRTMWTGYGRSVNTYWVWMEEQIGAQYAVAMAKRLGIQFRARSDASLATPARAGGWGAFTLGVSDTTPLDLANAYATVAADGTYCSPLPVLSVTDQSGHKLPVANPTCHRAVGVNIARGAADAARCPVGDQSFYHKCDGGTATMVRGIVGRPVAGKTGSSQENATESFVGFTPQLAVAATACDPDDPSDAVGASVSSAVDIAVARTMATALDGTPVLQFHSPTHQIAYGSGSDNSG
jgi:membrane peptidoglycan carboxypeptidase